ncbi:GTP cyclohydrolase II [Nocardia huaxiensis]|uniref:GTP cyclohydrolase II n=2 Tax=Nocardia huaxiensis TaxID=2755382 RepID=A0A7D6VEE8_9NOCA|nr:GTP cyclohydrolase II [Nocardia huaxiensis]
MRVRVAELPGGSSVGSVLLFGELQADPLVRMHSRCLYGDALRSEDCDCGPELDLSLDRIQAEGGGVLIYLEQEGRGAGLLTKAKGLRLSQTRGWDTYKAYRSLGFPADLRSYEPAAFFLRFELGLGRIRLLTNSPNKVAALRCAGIEVTPVTVHTEPQTERARKYLSDKQILQNHDLPPLLRTLPSATTAQHEPVMSISPVGVVSRTVVQTATRIIKRLRALVDGYNS